MTTKTATKTITRRVKTSEGLKEYTYLGCPLTRNRSPWCFGLCTPDAEGHGYCRRVAPHALKGRIQLGILNYNQRQREAQSRELGQVVLAAPRNGY